MPGGCGALAAAFRNYDILSALQRQQLLQVSCFDTPSHHVLTGRVVSLHVKSSSCYMMLSDFWRQNCSASDALLHQMPVCQRASRRC